MPSVVLRTSKSSHQGTSSKTFGSLATVPMLDQAVLGQGREDRCKMLQRHHSYYLLPQANLPHQGRHRLHGDVPHFDKDSLQTEEVLRHPLGNLPRRLRAHQWHQNLLNYHLYLLHCHKHRFPQSFRFHQNFLMMFWDPQSTVKLLLMTSHKQVQQLPRLPPTLP